MVESAISRPYTGYYHSIAKKAAALVQSVATNHGFADGNKRTAVILTHLLLRKSGYMLRKTAGDISIGEAFEELILGTVNGQVPFDDLIAWFKARLRKLP